MEGQAQDNKARGEKSKPLKEKKMRTITLSTGKTIQVNPLKGRDVRELMAMPQEDNFAQVFETLKRAGIAQDEADDLPFPDILALNKAILAETYGLEEEIKN